MDKMKNKIVTALLIITLLCSISGCGWAHNMDANAKIPVMDTAPNTDVDARVSLVDKTANKSATSTQIQPDEAKKIALEDAGLSEADVTFQTVDYEYDDGLAYYEIDFYSQINGNGYKYEYDISLTDGRIISYSSKPIQTQMPIDDVLSEAEIEQIVKEKAGITETLTIPLRLTQDDGQVIYEGEFVYGEKEYEFEIAATSGIIVDWDVESIYHD